MANKHIPRALVTLGGTHVVLPVEDAVAAFTLLCKGDVVNYDWSSKTYKRAEANSSDYPSLRMFSLADYAALTLNTD